MWSGMSSAAANRFASISSRSVAKLENMVAEVHAYVRVNDYRTSLVQMKVTKFVGDRKPLAGTAVALIHPNDDPGGLAHEHARHVRRHVDLNDDNA